MFQVLALIFVAVPAYAHPLDGSSVWLVTAGTDSAMIRPQFVSLTIGRNCLFDRTNYRFEFGRRTTPSLSLIYEDRFHRQQL